MGLLKPVVKTSKMREDARQALPCAATNGDSLWKSLAG